MILRSEKSSFNVQKTNGRTPHVFHLNQDLEFDKRLLSEILLDDRNRNTRTEGRTHGQTDRLILEHYKEPDGKSGGNKNYSLAGLCLVFVVNCRVCLGKESAEAQLAFEF